MRYFKLSFAVIMLLFSTTVFAQTAGQQLQGILKQIYTIQGNFSQQLYDGRGRLTQSSKGTLAIYRPGKFRWEIIWPSKQLFVSSGDYLYIYDKSLQQVTIQKVKRGIAGTPASILSGAARLLTNYFIVQYSRGWYFLQPRYSGSMLKLVKIHFNGQQLDQMQIIDKMNQKSILYFSNIRTNVPMQASLFNFKPPRGIDVIRQ